MSEDALREEIEKLGFELVEMEKVGPPARPILRLRIDREDGGVSLQDCARVSRALQDLVPDSTVLEVSSPGVERPLVRDRDFERFAGREVAVLHGKKKIVGELIGIRGGAVALRLPGGEEMEVPRSEIKRANLVFRWGQEHRQP